MPLTRLGGCVAALALGLGACAGDTTPGWSPDGGSGTLDCASSACGGDPTGHWTFASVCLADGSPDCPGTSYETTDVELDGFWSFGPDGRYRVVRVENGTLSWTWPAACVSSFDTCDELESGSRRCTGVVSSQCTCDATVYGALTDTGTWRLEGTRLELTSDEGERLTLGVCVSGSALLLRDGDTTWLLGS